MPHFKFELCACFGKPVDENPTQAMMEAAFREMGLDWRYLTIEVAPQNLPDAIRGFRAMGFRGGNFTIPHKVAIIPLIDELTATAQSIGAVNCIVQREGKLLGENTDGKGFLQSVREIIDVSGKSVTLLGAGGAARAVAVELLNAGVSSITLVNRSVERGKGLHNQLDKLYPGKAKFVSWQGDYAIHSETDIVINSTSIGLFPHIDDRVPIQLETLLPKMVVCDVIPNPPRTRFLREAESRGCRMLDGLGMLVNQGVIGIRLWTGMDANPEVMRHALEEVFGDW